MKTIRLTSEQAAELKRRGSSKQFQTQMNFLSQHNGLRGGKLHLLIGVPGGGKSTLRNTVIFDFLKNNPGKKIFLWLSEESFEDYETDLSKNPEHLELYHNVVVESEQEELAVKPFDQMILDFQEKVFQSDCDFFVFDNVTTSRMYARFAQQQEFALFLKKTISQHGCPGLIFAHTGSTIKEGFKGFIDMNDIRGSRDIVNLAEFLYVMQTFHVKQKVMTTIRITKNRGVSVKDRMFIFDYCEKIRVYKNDFLLDFEIFKKLYKKQNSLTGN